MLRDVIIPVTMLYDKSTLFLMGSKEKEMTVLKMTWKPADSLTRLFWCAVHPLTVGQDVCPTVTCHTLMQDLAEPIVPA